MDHELTKQLKDAGFKQGAATGNHHDGGKWIDDDGDIHDHEGGGDNEMYIPTLEELIEACGEDFWSLTYLMGSPATWKAAADRSTLRQVEPETYTTGATPTEAVARLWLALNKK